MGLISANEFADYSYLTEDEFQFDGDGAVLHCISGLGPSPDQRDSTRLGGWSFHSHQTIIARTCGSEFRQRSENPVLFPGVVSLFPCGPLSPDEEGVYSCMMKNSSMMIETRKMGLYLTGRSESLLILL